jgi:hypothetical protein
MHVHTGANYVRTFSAARGEYLSKNDMACAFTREKTALSCRFPHHCNLRHMRTQLWTPSNSEPKRQNRTRTLIGNLYSVRVSLFQHITQPDYII